MLTASYDTEQCQDTVDNTAAETCTHYTETLQVRSPVHSRNVMLSVTFCLRLLVQLHSYTQTQKRVVKPSM